MSNIEEHIEVSNGKGKEVMKSQVDIIYLEGRNTNDLVHLHGLLRVNIGNARLESLESGLNMSFNQYQWTLSIFYFGYILFELPANIVLRNWRASYWFAILTFAWGVCATTMAAVENFSGLALTRFLLGVCQAGFFPGVVYYMSTWYTRSETGGRLGIFWAFGSLGGAFNGLLSYGITQINNGGLQSWQWMFIIEGLPSILIAPFVAWYLPDAPETAKYLTQQEKEIVLRRLMEDAGPAHDDSWSWMQVISVFLDSKTYIFIVIYILGTIPLQGIVAFLPSIILNMGSWSEPIVQLLTIPPYTMACIGILFIIYYSGSRYSSATHIIFSNFILMIGFLILMFAPANNVAANYLGACIVTIAVYANAAMKAPWFNRNYGGLTRRAVAAAVIVSFGTIGGAIGGQIYYDPPDYFAGNTIAFACTGAQTIAVVIARIMLNRENKRRDALTQEQKDYEIFKYGGAQIAGDRHPDFRYDL
ncbi:major facilitator superfamily domain-containing protein [Spinellus fusiger]|nr:major facilitator superfamily domain-containing protein [Spinellus fusiger]